MNALKEVPRPVIPSPQGTTPVQDILNRLWVQDPRRKFTGFHSRLTDFESRSPILETAAAFILAGLLVSLFWFGSVQILKDTRMWIHLRYPVAPEATEPDLLLPPAVAPAFQKQGPSLRQSKAAVPRLVPNPQEPAAPPEVAVPDNLHARFYGPRSVEFVWDPVGPGFDYQVYAAEGSSMKDAKQLLGSPIPAPHMLWEPDDGIKDAWIAVKGIAPNGLQTAFSPPLRVRFPL